MPMTKEQLMMLPDYQPLLLKISSRTTLPAKLMDLDVFMVKPRSGDQPNRVQVVECLHEHGAIDFADIAAFCRAGQEAEAPRPRGIANPGGSK